MSGVKVARMRNGQPVRHDELKVERIMRRALRRRVRQICTGRGTLSGPAYGRLWRLSCVPVHSFRGSIL